MTHSRNILARRRRTGFLKPDESDRAARIALVFVRAEAALASADKACRWLNRPNRALGMVEPVTRLDTDAGVQQLMEILGRI